MYLWGSHLSNLGKRDCVGSLQNQRNETSKQATTFVRASFKVGNAEYPKILPLQVLKDTVPEGGVSGEAPAEEEQVPPPPLDVPPMIIEEANEQNNNNNNNNDVNFNEVQAEERGGGAPHQAPASVNHGRSWYYPQEKMK